mmetsp:Transcript_3014/g.3769  ORF Transcript_3014/g.3769 Transcript_3014/m.3769 type:complete len:210 (-) Transcript_3014:124-753(-)
MHCQFGIVDVYYYYFMSPLNAQLLPMHSSVGSWYKIEMLLDAAISFSTMTAPHCLYILMLSKRTAKDVLFPIVQFVTLVVVPFCKREFVGAIVNPAERESSLHLIVGVDLFSMSIIDHHRWLRNDCPLQLYMVAEFEVLDSTFARSFYLHLVNKFVSWNTADTTNSIFQNPKQYSMFVRTFINSHSQQCVFSREMRVEQCLHEWEVASL